MIPLRLSFIVSSDLRDPRGSESCLLFFWELILQKRFKTGTVFLVGNAGSLQKQIPWFTASDIFIIFYYCLSLILNALYIYS